MHGADYDEYVDDDGASEPDRESHTISNLFMKHVNGAGGWSTAAACHDGNDFAFCNLQPSLPSSVPSSSPSSSSSSSSFHHQHEHRHHLRGYRHPHHHHHHRRHQRHHNHHRLGFVRNIGQLKKLNTYTFPVTYKAGSMPRWQSLVHLDGSSVLHLPACAHRQKVHRCYHLQPSIIATLWVIWRFPKIGDPNVVP